MPPESTESKSIHEPLPAVDRLALEPMDPQVKSIQPGGGFCMALELAWGRCRRAWLKTCRGRYLDRMRACRINEPENCPIEILDPRDEKFYRNQMDSCWDPSDDPFRWRDRLPFARFGLAELIISWLVCGVLAAVLFRWWWPATYVPLALALFVAWFFRNPPRAIPQSRGLVVSPADGTIVGVEEEPFDEFVGGPTIVISIFLSIFNVHINRSPVEARVIGITYSPGKFLNALRARSARENEQLAVRFETSRAPHRRMIVRQIAGAIARRIVCVCKPGDELLRGKQFGMIKLGSRTELVVPKEKGLEVCVVPGQKVLAGTTVLVKYPAG